MRKIPKIITKVREYHDANGREKTMRRLRIGDYAMDSLLNFSENTRLNTGILRSLYQFFDVNFDDFYYSHFQGIPSIKRHEWIIGNIFRAKRIRLGYTIHDVSRRLKVDEKTIGDLERGETLPVATGYTIIKLFEMYEMTEHERQTITWLVGLIHDAISVFKKELENF